MQADDFNLLIVDDSEDNRDMLSRRLKRRGYGVFVAEDGLTALDLVARETIDLVLLDIMMPGIDGVEVLRRLRAEHTQAELPVIMVTAKAASEDMVEALDLGANDYVTKPLDFPVVLARIQSQLRSKAAAPAPPKTSAEPTAGELEPGAVLAGKYRLEENIGSGNFGVVYRARHLDLDLDVALKVLPPMVTANEESLKRFRREGVAACRVRHPNAVMVSDFGVTGTGVAYLVMELLQGRDLVGELRTRGRLAPRRCLEILGPVCEVLAEAHDVGLVHRDVKPENVFLHRGPHGEEVKVLDFGIAKLVGETVTQENLTAEGWILGTPAYIAPERVSGEPYDGKSDVYSLGILLFEMLTGHRPFRGRNDDPMSLLMMHVNAEPPTLASFDSELPAALEEVVAAAIRKRPDERPDARELGRALARAIGPVSPDTAAGPAAGREADDLDPRVSTVALDVGSSSGRNGFKRWLRKVIGSWS